MKTIASTLYFKSKKFILAYLETHESASTEELINYVSNQDAECRDKVPQALISMVKEKKIAKAISKEKKGFIWYILST